MRAGGARFLARRVRGSAGDASTRERRAGHAQEKCRKCTKSMVPRE